MAAVGMFGKVPTFGDFVSVGSGTPGYRKFERWLEDSNDIIVERGQALRPQPMGFVIRHEDTRSLLVGILVGSGDSVGRSFPLSLFYELKDEGLSLAGVPQAMGQDLARLASVARKAGVRDTDDIRKLVQAMTPPTDKDVAIRSHAQLGRLRIVPAQMMLQRTYGEGALPCYGSEVILRACELAAERRSGTPLILEGRARTDVELMFLLASVEVMSGGAQPQAVLWEVRSRRALFVLGEPDPRLLALMVSEGEADRLWPMWTDRPEVAERSREQLPVDCRQLLDEPGQASAKDFLDSMAVACKPRSHQPATPDGKQRQRQGKWQSRVP